MDDALARLKAAVREIPDFPTKGILFRDITTILQDAELLQLAIDVMAEPYAGVSIDKVVGIESRGFIFAPPLAMRFGAGFVPIRKQGKLPSTTINHGYQLEYGSAVMEIHSDSIGKGDRVILVDDLIATGGSAAAAVAMVRSLGGDIVGASFLIELSALHGRAVLGKLPVHTHIVY